MTDCEVDGGGTGLGGVVRLMYLLFISLFLCCSWVQRLGLQSVECGHSFSS